MCVYVYIHVYIYIYIYIEREICIHIAGHGRARRGLQQLPRPAAGARGPAYYYVSLLRTLSI